MIFAFFAVCTFLVGLLLLAYLERRELREDNRKLINEWSVRTGGRLVFKPEPKQVPISSNGDRGEFAILTPSMAEAEAMSRAEAEQNGHSDLSEADLEHLYRNGVIK